MLKSYPYTMADRYEKLYGKDFQTLLSYLERPLYKSIRLNTLRSSPNKLGSVLKEKGFKYKILGEGLCFLLKEEPFNISAMHEHLFGNFYIQGVAEISISPQLAPIPGELVWDMCAAPGGKTTHLAQIMENDGTIVATDVSKDKINALRNNIARLGVKNAVIIREDARKLKTSEKFDKVLLDAPCTGSGIIRKDPTRKFSREMDDIWFMQALQKGLLQKAAMTVKEGGDILYSTCSLEPEENELVISWALKNLGVETMPLLDSFLDISPPFEKPFGKALAKGVERCGRIHPYVNDTNGMFLARLRKL